MRHVLPKPLASLPDAELPTLPPADAPGEDLAPADVSPVRSRPQVAVLRFLDPASLERRITLRFPFEWEGREVRAIVVRRLVVAEVGEIMGAYDEDEPVDLYDFLAAMTGLPAPVLRGMQADDGEEVLTAGRPLLPRYIDAILFLRPMAPETAGTSSGTGGASPSRPPEA